MPARLHGLAGPDSDAAHPFDRDDRIHMRQSKKGYPNRQLIYYSA
jgi:hypothetical protein